MEFQISKNSKIDLNQQKVISFHFKLVRKKEVSDHLHCWEEFDIQLSWQLGFLAYMFCVPISGPLEIPSFIFCKFLYIYTWIRGNWNETVL